VKPLIGITADTLHDVPGRDGLWNTTDYFRAVSRAGGLPVLLPYLEELDDADALLDRLDGILFSGGNDVDPVHYGEAPHPGLGYVSVERDSTEMVLARKALERDMPIFGICRGHQVLAVVEGGTLWQDIPGQVPGAIKHAHRQPKWHPIHTVAIRPESRLAAILGTEIMVNSRHHQAVRDVPPGWLGTATAPDGLNEAMEKPGARFAVSVQWHPENFTGRAYNFDHLFAAFVAACKEA